MNLFTEWPKRHYDDWHKDWEILWKFMTLNMIEKDAYSWKWVVLKDDWHLWIIEENEVSWIHNPSNWWTRYEFIDIWTLEDLQECVYERFPWWYKLIDYLNEEFDEKFSDLDEEDKENNHFTYQMWLDDVHICSKKDWHIQWLYDHDYIDINKALKLLQKFAIWSSITDRIIMYLSIENEPLKILASILK